jgi:HEPN domain-containing protein
MDEAKRREIRQWLIKSEHDLRSSQRLFAGDDPILDTAVYHCQQAAEKALKAYLTFQDSPFQKVHVLGILVEQCLEFDRSFESIRDIADVLTPFATAFRYPGDVLEPDPDDAKEALEAATEIIEFVYARIPDDIKRFLDH